MSLSQKSAVIWYSECVEDEDGLPTISVIRGVVMNRVLVLSFDALEYDLVESSNMKNLKQVEYGKTALPLKPEDPILTPVIWCSFITGEMPEVHGIRAFDEWKNPIINRLQTVFFHIPHSILGSEKRKKLASLLGKLGFKTRPRFQHRQNIKCDTIFDDINDSIAISVPSFNEDEVNRELSLMLVEAPKSRVKSKVWSVFQDRKRRLFEALEKDWRLLMVHFFITDVIQHLYFYDSKYIESMYQEMDELVREVKSRIEGDTLVLVVSDHGQKKGLHTPYGFYSCNRRLNLQKAKITDFAGIIRRELGVPLRKEIENVKMRLRELGYF